MNADDFEPVRRLTSRTDAREAFDDTLSEVRRQLRLFDDDGRFWGLERRPVVEALRTILRERADARITMILHDLTHVERNCALLRDLVRTYSPRLQIRLTDEAVRGFSRGMVIADNAVVLRRPQFGQPITYVDYEERSIANADRLFGELVESSSVGISGAVTGL